MCLTSLPLCLAVAEHDAAYFSAGNCCRQEENVIKLADCILRFGYAIWLVAIGLVAESRTHDAKKEVNLKKCSSYNIFVS